MITIIKRDGSVTEGTPSGANAEGVAVPSTDISTDTGANVQALAEPAGTDVDVTPVSDIRASDAEDSILPAESSAKGEHTKQDAETNSRYAAARRAAEKQRDEAIASAELEQKAKLERFITGLNIKGPSGKIITTEEEYNAYISERDAKKRAEEISDRSDGEEIDSDKVEELVKSHPDVVAAREAKEKLEQAQDALMSERAQKAVEAEVSAVRESFPEIQSLDDIVKLPKYPQIKEKVSAGYSLSDAVKLAYEDIYIKRKQAAAAQAARNAVSSTAHLSATKAHGSGGVNVTEAQIRSYMANIPGSTREQAIAAYRKYKIQR